MKWKIEKRYLGAGAVLLIVILLSIFFNYTLEHRTRIEEIKAIVNNTMFPIIAGAVLAYLLNPILHFWEGFVFMPLFERIFSREEDRLRRNKMARTFGILFTIALFLVLLIGGLYLVIPQVYASLVKIVTDAPTYYAHITKWIASLDKDQSEVSKYILMGIERIYSQAIQYLNTDILPNMDKIVAGITSGIVGGLRALLNIILALIISIYVMAGKETLISVLKKLVYSLFSREHANAILRGVRFADGAFGGFINGKIIDSFIIGAICYCFMVIAQFDYAVLISIIVGVTNVIPYFGPFIGGIPSTLILLMVNPKQGIIFGIFVIILQQVDGNIIGPIILGDRLQLSSMWILFAILIGGGFFGVPGMILGAPCFACVYALLGTLCKNKLQKKNLPLNSEAYYHISSIKEDGSVILKSEWRKRQKEKQQERRQKQQREEKQEKKDLQDREMNLSEESEEEKHI